ncbi:hypothetical protein [Halorussus halobius]|uniref:hypothetical protein n=1 Tax=Halorussus halobius TaxID=1710537 RepID=UPI0010929055|nr:hypothetical protein [Halorussus halobius]
MSENLSEADESVLEEIRETTGVSYDPDTRTVEFTDVKNDTEQYISLVEYLIEQDYIEKDDLPVSAKRAQTRYLINSSASHENRDMVRPSEVGESAFLETNHDTASKKRYASKFIEDFVLGR